MEKNRKAMQARLENPGDSHVLAAPIWRKKTTFSAYWLDDFDR